MSSPRTLYLAIVVLLTTIITTPLCAGVLDGVSIDSSSGFNASYPASNLVDGVYGSANMAWATTSGAWVIFDLGSEGQSFLKVRITPPRYGGTPPANFNPTIATLEFSDDKSTWTDPIPWSAPLLESIGTTDWSETAMPGVITARYVRFSYVTAGRIGEFQFLDGGPTAVWELNQTAAYTNAYPAIQTVDNDPDTFAVIDGSAAIVYDLGATRDVYGFDMLARELDNLNPTSGDIYVSDAPDANYVSLGSWTLSPLDGGTWGRVDFGDANAVTGRYVKLDDTGSQWAEIQFLTAPAVHTSDGFNSSYPAANMIDGIYGTANMAWAGTSDAFVIFDRGDRNAACSKIRITPPRYGGGGSSTFNPTSGTLSFSDDLVSWTAPLSWSAPALESVSTTDWSESALPSQIVSRYIRFDYGTTGRISEMQFVDTPQTAVWEMDQSKTYTNLYPMINAVDYDGDTFGAIPGSNLTYDIGRIAAVRGFTIRSRELANLNPTSGTLYVSTQPDAGFTSIGTWNLSPMAANTWATVDFGDANAVAGRYIKLSGGGQYAEFQALTAPCNTTVYAAQGFNASYPADNMVDGIYGTANMAWADITGAWVIFDRGANAQAFRKIRITPPRYGGTGSSSYNPTQATISCSDDLLTWSDGIAWNAPALESTGCTDWAECAMPMPISSRYIKFQYDTLGRISEFQFITEPQLAVYELAQNVTYTNLYPMINTADADADTFGVEFYGVIYDTGYAQNIYGFEMLARELDDLNPTSGTLYVSDVPDANFTAVDTWNMAGLDAGTTGTVDLGQANAITGRYVKVTSGGQWAEINMLATSADFTIVENNTAATAIIVPVNRPAVVDQAADELQDIIYEATGATLSIYTEPYAPTCYDGLIYLGRCDATKDAGIDMDMLASARNAYIIRRMGDNLFIAGIDEDGTAMDFNTDAGTLFGVYAFVEEQLGVCWLWPGDTGQVVP